MKDSKAGKQYINICLAIIVLNVYFSTNTVTGTDFPNL